MTVQEFYDIMCVQGKEKATRTQLLCRHKQMCSWRFDERSEPGKPLVSRVSARNLKHEI